MVFINGKDKNIIDEFIGERYKRKYLKRWTIWIRKALMDRAKRTPDSYLIETESGKRYKLLIAYDKGAHFISDIVANHKKVRHLGCSSEILTYGKRFILVEYIDGDFPSFDDAEFVVNLAKTLAILHRVSPEQQDTSVILDNVRSDINSLEGLLKNGDHIFSLITQGLPDRIPVGITYGDHNYNNYVWSDGQLRLIDLGSFVDDVVLDIHLAGSALFYKIDVDLFRQAYLEAGGFDFLFDYLETLKFISLIRSAAYNYERYNSAPVLDWRLRNARKHNYTWALGEIRRIVDVV